MKTNFKKEYKAGARWLVVAGRKNSGDAFTAVGPNKPKVKDVTSFRRAIAKNLKVSLRQIEARSYPISEDGAVVVPCSMVGCHAVFPG